MINSFMFEIKAFKHILEFSPVEIRLIFNLFPHVKHTDTCSSTVCTFIVSLMSFMGIF